MFKKILRLYNTVRYLKIKQILWRFINLFPRIIFWTNEYPIINNSLKNYAFIPRKRITKDYKTFTFLNKSRRLEEVGWDNVNNSRLWNYNLHYFEFLLVNNKIEDELDLQYQLIENWIELNPFKDGIGWEPYPTSLRIINWIKWHWTTKKLSEKAKVSLWNQVLWLSINLEYHLMGNHLFVNAKALLFASAFFNQKKESKIFKKANSIIKSELDRQFLSDGAHFELSPMYHSAAMEDLLDIINIGSNLPTSFPLKMFKEKYLKGMYWLKTMIYNNEELSHFNDCANEIAPKYSEIEKFANKLEIKRQSHQLSKFNFHKKSGFIVFKDLSSHLIADFGKVGPDYLPGHAHADTLSFELAIKGNRVIVNSGTSIYSNSEERKRQRGTSAHSTVQIDNQNSSDVWSSFRVGRRANTFDLKIGKNKNSLFFSASHDGYKSLNNSPIHKRSFNLNKNTWTILDEISGKGNQIVSRFYLHPEISIREHELGFILSNGITDLAYMKFNKNISAKIIDANYSDRFGYTTSSKCILVKLTSPNKIELKINLIF